MHATRFLSLQDQAKTLHKQQSELVLLLMTATEQEPLAADPGGVGLQSGIPGRALAAPAVRRTRVAHRLDLRRQGVTTPTTC
mmetsp:Transcript_42646/g.101267  ORF Transcript_42646/g.101267 Transcript_42646/m.101267 type:complete len:82 (-) Transcript_42646:1949-2194(-)